MHLMDGRRWERDTPIAKGQAARTRSQDGGGARRAGPAGFGQPYPTNASAATDSLLFRLALGPVVSPLTGGSPSNFQRGHGAKATKVPTSSTQLITRPGVPPSLISAYRCSCSAQIAALACAAASAPSRLLAHHPLHLPSSTRHLVAVFPSTTVRPFSILPVIYRQ